MTIKFVSGSTTRRRAEPWYDVIGGPMVRFCATSGPSQIKPYATNKDDLRKPAKVPLTQVKSSRESYMRRIAALTMTTALMVGSMATFATSADAAAGKSWKAPNKVKGTESWGTYTRSGGKTFVTGKLRDTSRNGLTACVRFMFTEGDRIYYSRHSIKYKTGPLFDGRGTISIKAESGLSSHLYVQECRMKTSTRKVTFPKNAKGKIVWKKLF